MDRVQLKMDAKAAMQQANPHPVLVTLVYLVILTAVNFVVSMMSGFSSLFTVLVTDPDAAAAISLGMLVPSLLLSLAATLVIGFIQMGYTAYTLRVVNRQPAGINDLFCLCPLLPENLGTDHRNGHFCNALVPALLVPRHHCLLPLFPGLLHTCGKSGKGNHGLHQRKQGHDVRT